VRRSPRGSASAPAGIGRGRWEVREPGDGSHGKARAGGYRPENRNLVPSWHTSCRDLPVPRTTSHTLPSPSWMAPPGRATCGAHFLQREIAVTAAHGDPLIEIQVLVDRRQDDPPVILSLPGRSRPGRPSACRHPRYPETRRDRLPGRRTHRGHTLVLPGQDDPPGLPAPPVRRQGETTEPCGLP